MDRQNTKGLFKWSQENHFHISVGVLLTNEEGAICTHHLRLEDEDERFRDGMGSATQYYILMRESIEDGETLEDVIKRGLKEEFGATGTTTHYLGSIQSIFPMDGFIVEKTTLYFHVVCTSFDSQSRHQNDGESKSTIEWIMPERLRDLMKKQGALMERTDRNESKVIETYLALKR